MISSISTLSLTAAGIAFVHTLLGPDHYLPFIGIARAEKWSAAKTAKVTAACGVIHVASSVLIGFIGIALGLSLSSLVSLETIRGSLAAWALIAFGLTYFAWGIKVARRNHSHSHWHQHDSDLPHLHTHNHQDDHLHAHPDNKGLFASWSLFTIFLFGPCEPLIPLLMYPAATSSLFDVAVVAGVFTLVTILTMLAIVMIGYKGTAKLRLPSGKQYVHAFAGLMIFSCGMLIEFAGL